MSKIAERDEPEFLTTAEVAERLRVSGRTVRHWADRGHIEVIRLAPKTLRYRRSDIEAMLSGQSTEAAHPISTAA